MEKALSSGRPQPCICISRPPRIFVWRVAVARSRPEIARSPRSRRVRRGLRERCASQPPPSNSAAFIKSGRSAIFWERRRSV